MATEPTTPLTRRQQQVAAFVLLAAALIASAVVLLIVQPTRAPIARNEAAQLMKTLRTVLPAGAWDNEPHLDRILVTAPDLLGSEEPLPIYRARLRGEPVAAVITVVARKGYVGPIRLWVTLTADGRIYAVRAVAHSETPGLGDRIDADRSTWMENFSGRSLDDPPAASWAVRRDGGEFDQMTGATITSRAVVGAVRDAALYYAAHREEIFARPAQ